MLPSVVWDQQEVVSPQNGYHVPHFKENWGAIQGRLIFPNLFNFIFENVVRNWLVLTVEDQLVALEGLRLAVGRCLGLFYAENGVVGLRDPE